MGRRISIFILFFVTAVSVNTTTWAAVDKFINKTMYDNIYPSTLNQNVQNAGIDAQMSQKKPSITNTTGTKTTGRRRVVKRPTKARAATTNTPAKQNTTNSTRRRVVARPNMTRNKTNAAVRSNTKRRIVARNAAPVNRARSGKVARNTNASSGNTKYKKLPSAQCFANYKECMDSYCERADTAYNRCYCAARLAQIDAKYQNKIDSLIQQIIKLKYNTDATDAEIKSYWDASVGTYTGTNPWVSIDNALNINWADTESRVRGQNAFNTGHSYCVNYLRSCSYMASNLRDAYKSEIERDCSTYEKGLERIQLAAESVIESYDQ